MNQDATDSEGTLKNWLKIASVIFAAWAVMIPLGIWVVERDLNGIDLQMRDQLISGRLIDHRLDLLEERQLETVRRLNAIDDHLRYVDEHLEHLDRSRR